MTREQTQRFNDSVDVDVAITEILDQLERELQQDNACVYRRQDNIIQVLFRNQDGTFKAFHVDVATHVVKVTQLGEDHYWLTQNYSSTDRCVLEIMPNAMVEINKSIIAVMKKINN